MNIRNFFFLIAVLVAGVYFTGCTEEDGPSGGGPTGVQVTSISDQSIGVRWTRETGDVGTNTIIATPVGGGAAITETISGGASSGVIDGLSLNQRYTIQVESSTNNKSAGVEWATAIRSGVITLWETAAPAAAGPSGLVLSNNPHAAPLTGPNNEADRVDVVLATTDPLLPLPNLSLQAADVMGAPVNTTRKTRFGDSYFKVRGGLNSDYYSVSFASDIKTDLNAAVNFFDDFTFPGQAGSLPSIGDTSIIILARTIDGNHARIEIVPQPGGFLHRDQIYAGQSYRVVDVIVSYQPMVSVGYASRPISGPGKVAPRVGGAKAIVKQ